MEIEYKNEDTRKRCQDCDYAKRYYNTKIVERLKSVINFIKNANNFHDIIQYPPFHFHRLSGRDKDKYAIDVAGRKEAYRMIIIPLDNNKSRIENRNDKFYFECKQIKIVLIMEVSKHYE